MAKKTTPPQVPPNKKVSFLPLLVAGAAGFLLALFVLRGDSMVGECPMYSEACPVTSTLMQVELALEKNDLPKAKAEANKLSEQLERTMPDLARLAEKVSKSTTINQARARLQELEKKMMSDVSATYQK